MSAYEVALLVATALFVCILLWDNHKIRGRLERSEADIAWLKRAMHNTIDVHQKTMDGHKIRLDNHKNYFEKDQLLISKIRADVDRLLKADMMRRRPQFMNSDRQYAAEIEEARRAKDGAE